MSIFYQAQLKSQLERSEYLILCILVNLLQSIKKVSLEALATAFPLPILFHSRRKKIQRFLSIPELKIEKLWFPLIKIWLTEDFPLSQVLYIAIDRTNWGSINLLVISLIWEKRAIPIYFELLPKLGSSNFGEQQAALFKVLPLFQEYKTVVLGDREFCSVVLANWLREQGVYFCLRLKKTEFLQTEKEIWVQLKDLELSPGLSFYLQGVKVTKSQNFTGFNIAGKWKRKYRGMVPEEGWFILTNLDSLDAAIAAYCKRFRIEEMFRDFKIGGYNLEKTGCSGERLISLLILISLAYTSASLEGKRIKQMGIQKYIGRVKESKRSSRRHSSFYIGLYGHTWTHFMEPYREMVTDLMRLTPNKLPYYQRGLRAKKLILSIL